MISSNFGRALATATAALTTIALSATSAGAANLGPAQFSGAAKAQALSLSLDGPAELLGLLGQGPRVIDLGVSLTEVTTSSANELFASTDLIAGTLASVAPTGGSSTTDGDSHSAQFAGLEEGPVTLGLGTTAYNLDRATRAVTSTSELASLSISLDGVLATANTPVGGVLDEVETVVDTVLTETDALVGDIVGEINAVVNELEATLESTAGLVLNIPDVELTDLNVVRDLRSTNVLEIRKLWSETSVTPVGDTVRSAAKSGISGASILGGMVTIPEWTFSAWAEAAGTPGSAQWGGNTEALALNVDGIGEVISLNGSNLTILGNSIDLNDPALPGLVPTEVTDQLNGLVKELFALTGLSIQNGSVRGEAAPDGSFATATASAFSLSLAPMHAATAIPELAGLVDSLGMGSADELFRLQLDLLPVTATARAAAAAVPASSPQTPNLPRTGGGAAALALGFLGMGSAGFLRRRF